MNAITIPFLFFSLFAGDEETVDVFVGEKRFSTEIASTPMTQMRGLMGRAGLGSDEGMLFVYEEDREVQFWMKGVSFPIDMIFLDRCGQVVKIHPDAVPDSIDIVSSGVSVRAVLELQGGASKRAQMRIGDIVDVEGDMFDAC